MSTTVAAPARAVAEFEAVYRANVGAIAAFFARRCSEPQLVADLTSETFTQAIASLSSFDERAGRALLARMARLPELERAALELVDLDGLAPREAATVLRISRGALRVRLFRARSRLRTTEEPS